MKIQMCVNTENKETKLQKTLNKVMMFKCMPTIINALDITKLPKNGF